MSYPTLKTLAKNATLLSFAVFNLAIFFNTTLKLKTRIPRDFDYLDDDRPIHMPVRDIPLAEMTFQEVSQFSLDGSPVHKGNWLTLYTNQFGIGFQHLGPFHWRYISEEYHNLHCLYTMQNDFDKSDHANHPSPHFIHCLFYLRQFFLCNADMSLEEGDLLKRNFTMDRVGETRICRDWDYVANWVEDEFQDWLTLNDVSAHELDKPSTFNADA